MSKKKSLAKYSLIVLSMFFWGLSFVWYKQAYPEFEPITIIFFRLLISFPLIMVTALLMKKLKLPKRKDWVYFILLSFFEPLVYFICESYGMKYVSSTLASVIIATIPLFTPFLAFYFYKERLGVSNYFGIVVSFLGVLLVVANEKFDVQGSFFGVGLMFLAVLSTQGYAVLLKKLSSDYNGVTIVGFQNLIGAVLFLPLFFGIDYKGFSFSDHKLVDYKPILYLSIFASTFAFLFYIEGLKFLGLNRSMVFTNFIPIVTAFFSVLLLNEGMGVFKIIGISLTIVGLFLSQSSGFSNYKILRS